MTEEQTTSPAQKAEKELNLGVQPLDTLLEELQLSNHDVVAFCHEGLTHKAMQRARKGRRLTPRMKVRITETLNLAIRERHKERQFRVRDLFNY